MAACSRCLRCRCCSCVAVSGQKMAAGGQKHCTKLHICYKKLKSIPLARHGLLLYAVTFLAILPGFCHNLQYSVYFMKPSNKEFAQDHMRKENDARLEVAKNYLHMINRTKLHGVIENVVNKRDGVDIALAIVTVSRNRHSLDNYEPQYLTQVVAKFLMLLQEARSQGFNYTLHFAICNVDEDPGSYHEAHALSNVVHLINRFQKLSLSLIHRLEKEKQDYVFCMNASLGVNPRYVMLIEDDAIPHEDFFTVLGHFLHTHFDNRISRGEFSKNEEDFTYIKLYHPERVLGYINLEPDRLTELFGIGFVFGTFSTLAYLTLPLKFNSHIGASRVYVWILFAVYWMLVAMAIGRPHLAELRRTYSPYLYSYVSAPECCTPAMLFPKEGAQRVIRMLSSVTCKKYFGKDTALEFFRKKRHLKAYMIQPNMVKHIGMYSSLRKSILDPFIV